ncbi:MAG: glycosyltransferase family 1 protein [Chitinophagales bacterium]
MEKKITIAFDAKRAFRNKSGLGNYSRTLIGALQKQFPEHHYALYASKRPIPEYAHFAEEMTTYYPEGWWMAAPVLWRSFGMARAINADVFHGLSNELPLLKRTAFKKVVTIHDLIFLKHREQYPVIDRAIYDFKSKWACTYADAIIATSEETKEDIVRFYGIPEDKVTVVYQSCERQFFEVPNNEKLANVRRKLQLPERYILNVSSFYSRKNHAALIAAFEKIAGQIEEHLVLSGHEGDLREAVERRIASSKFASRIHLLQIANDDLPAVYAMATAFVYPSFFEGFGIQLAEAMAMRTPLVISNIRCFREVAGDAALYFNPNAEEELAKLLLQLLSSGQLQNELRAKAQIRSVIFSPQNFAEQIMKVYKKVLES